ncbi:MAG: bifunctional GrpB family protein/GNAT family N-acetyltransferase [Gammaproteobacteria bacterium]|nr:bifunctional GrpB family protein/GNAT family N-acetyltransferase [Gammaproteobacteria bacterium]
MTIILTPYNPLWPKLFEEEKAMLQKTLGNTTLLRIEHIGSTAIPEIHAKPVIDILIGVRNLKEFKEIDIKKIISLGYRYVPAFESELPHRRYFEKDDNSGNRTYQIHLVNYPSAWWEKHILFRNYLRFHSDAAKEYQQHKLQLSKQFNDTLLYAKAKTEFCQNIDKLAFHDFNINTPFISSGQFNAYIPQISCLDEYKKMVQDKDFISCYGIALSKEKAHTIVTSAMKHWDEHGFGLWMWYDKLDNQFVGCVGLKIFEESVELVYGIMPSYWGQGITAQLCRLVINHAFNHLKLDNLKCFTWIENKRSQKVMEKLGFQHERDFIHANLPHKLYQLKNEIKK